MIFMWVLVPGFHPALPAVAPLGLTTLSYWARAPDSPAYLTEYIKVLLTPLATSLNSMFHWRKLRVLSGRHCWIYCKALNVNSRHNL